MNGHARCGVARAADTALSFSLGYNAAAVAAAAAAIAAAWNAAAQFLDPRSFPRA